MSRNQKSNNKSNFSPVLEDFYSLQLTKGEIEAKWPAIVKIPIKSDEKEEERPRTPASVRVEEDKPKQRPLSGRGSNRVSPQPGEQNIPGTPLPSVEEPQAEEPQTPATEKPKKTKSKKKAPISG